MESYFGGWIVRVGGLSVAFWGLALSSLPCFSLLLLFILIETRVGGKKQNKPCTNNKISLASC